MSAEATEAHPLVMAAATRCGRCQAWIAWAQTESGRSMPISLQPDVDGNVAVRVTATGSIRARILSRDRPDLEGIERRHLPHAATCGRTQVSTPRRSDGVVPLYVAREARRRRQGQPPRPIPDGGLW